VVHKFCQTKGVSLKS